MIPWLNNAAVWLYKLMGFAVLMAIIVGVVSYMAAQVYYFASRSWLTPMIISPTDERVLHAQAQLAQAQAALESSQWQHSEAAAALADARMRLELEETFQEQFRQVTHADLSQRRAALARLQSLAGQYQALQPHLDAVAQQPTSFAAAMRDAHMIDGEQFMHRTQQSVQAQASQVANLDRSMELASRVESLGHQVKSLNGAHSDPNGAISSYDVLLWRREYDRSQVESRRLSATLAAYEKRVEQLAEAEAHTERWVNMMGTSPYLKAADHTATLAFVPYANLQGVIPGRPIYGCVLGPLWCNNVGQVTALLDVEVSSKHPVRNAMLRGMLLDVQVDALAAQRPVLHLGRASDWLDYLTDWGSSS